MPGMHDHPGTGAPEFLAGDIILFAGTGDLFSDVGRWLMRGKQEAPAHAVYTGQLPDPKESAWDGCGSA